MERYLIGGLGLATLIILAIAVMVPGERPDDGIPMLPWQITIDDANNYSVFGLTLDKTTLSEAENLYQEQSTVSLFKSPEDHYAVEAFLEKLYLKGIRANLVLNINIDQAAAAEMFDRGIRISRLGSGTSKVTLSPEDIQAIKQQTVSLVTYLPAADLEEELIQQRFGEPQQKIPEESGTVHWLYPDKGLDIALNPEGKEVFQYILPARFEQATNPLLEAQADAEAQAPPAQ